MSVADPSTCAECGARRKSVADRFCAYCGTEFPRAPTAAERRVDERADRFAAARHAPEYERALVREPNVAGAVGGGIFQVLFLGFFLVVTLFIGGSACSMGAFSGHGGGLAFGSLFALVPIGMATIALVALLSVGRKTARVASSPTERHLALVRDERTQVSGGGKNSSASTSYYVTLEYEDGRREEHPVDGRTAGRVSPGDLGVAYERGGILVDFVALDA